MIPSPPKVLLTTRLPSDLVARLSGRARVVEGSAGAGNMPREAALAELADAIGVINQNELRIDAELLARAPQLKIVANATAGYDNMDIAAMRARGVWGTNAPDAYAADTANHAMALMLALAKRLIEADSYVRAGRWSREGWMPGGRWDGMALDGREIGIVGFGGIGRQMARRAEAFGMIVHYHTRSGQGEPGWLPLDELLSRSDVVSLHCPLTPQTHHLIDAAAIAKMKPGAILINVSRGGVVKNDDLIAALASGRLGGAGLDVFEFEPDVPAELAAMSNVVLSPHLGGCTAEARLSAQRICVDNVLAIIAGEAPKTPVPGLAP